MNTVELVKNRFKRINAKLDDDMARVKMNDVLSEAEKEAELMILRAIKSLANSQSVAEMTKLQTDQAEVLESDLDALCVAVNHTIVAVLGVQAKKRAAVYEITLSERGCKSSKFQTITQFADTNY